MQADKTLWYLSTFVSLTIYDHTNDGATICIWAKVVSPSGKKRQEETAPNIQKELAWS